MCEYRTGRKRGGPRAPRRRAARRPRRPARAHQPFLLRDAEGCGSTSVHVNQGKAASGDGEHSHRPRPAADTPAEAARQEASRVHRPVRYHDTRTIPEQHLRSPGDLSMSSRPVRLLNDLRDRRRTSEVHVDDPPGNDPYAPLGGVGAPHRRGEGGGVRRVPGDQRNSRRHRRGADAAPRDGDHGAGGRRQDADDRRPVRRDSRRRSAGTCSTRPTTSTRRSSWPRGFRRRAGAARSKCARWWGGSDPRAGLP